ncbi:MAG: hypothetical protein WDW38_010106 [Sanguina aurantia]
MSRVAQRRRRRPLQGDATVDTVMPWPRRACEWRRQDPHRRHRAVATISQALIRDETRCFLGVGGHTGERPFWKLPGNGWKEPLHTPLHVDRLATPGPKTHTVSTRCIDCHTLLRPCPRIRRRECAPMLPSAQRLAGLLALGHARGAADASEKKALQGDATVDTVMPWPRRACEWRRQDPHRRHRAVATISQALIRDETRCFLGVGGHTGERPFWKLPGNGWKEPLHTPLHVDRLATPGPKTHTVSTRCIDCHTLLRPCPRIRRRDVGEEGPFRETPPWTLSCLGLGGRASGADKTPIAGTGRSQQSHKR